MTEKALDWVKAALAALGGVAAYLWGPWDPLCMALVAFVAIDYVTGVTKAAILKKLDSSTGFRGLGKKLFIFALVALGTMVDRVIPEANGAIRSAVMVFYIANEGLSILENAGEMGLPLPKALKDALKKFGGSDGDGGDGQNKT
ncbi:MAG TPA: phage holin family protein [Clostridia bacterium]|nr:phage holin family protein [Clostridia bacterium]